MGLKDTKMRDELREKLSAEVTRKQFLQYMAGIVLLVFGLDNLISLLVSDKHTKHLFPNKSKTAVNGFGSRRFGE